MKIEYDLDRLMYIDKSLKSKELFNKELYDLNDNEISILNQYINDCNNPIWKDLVYEGSNTMYQVSNTGEVRNALKMVMKQKINRDGYKMINLMINKNKHTSTIHKLVATTFIQNPENKPVINHINGNKQCNWYKNLEWVTYRENSKHAIETGLVHVNGTENPNNKFNEDTIHEICKLLESVLDATAIDKILSGTKAVTSGIKQGRIWKDISSKYKIPKPVSVLRPDDYKEFLTEMTIAGYNAPEILDILQPENRELERRYINLFQRRLLSKNR